MKKHRILIALLTLMAGLLTGKAAGSTATVLAASDIRFTDQHGLLAVEGTQLVDEHGEAIQLKGVSTHGIGWFGEYVNKDTFAALREMGANTIRLAMYTAEDSGYCVSDDQKRAELLRLIEDGISYTKELGMYCIVDWHVLNDQDPLTYLDEALLFFQEISQNHKEDSHIIYEICNEPNGSAAWEDVSRYARQVIPVIRANCSNVIIVGTPTWSQDVDIASQSPLEGENLMYALHFYAATHKEDLQNKMKTAFDAGLPLFVSEFGICDASGNGAVDEASADQWIRLLNERNISYVCWNLSNKNEASSLLDPSCSKLSDFAWEDLSREGKWYFSLLCTEDSPLTEDAAQARAEAEAKAARVDSRLTFSLFNTWESNGSYYYQFNGSLTSEEALSTWQIIFTFNDLFTISDCWNGKYSAEGNTLTISPESYNQTVEAGGTVTDIGFILCSSSPSLEFTDASVQS